MLAADHGARERLEYYETMSFQCLSRCQVPQEQLVERPDLTYEWRDVSARLATDLM
jgi:hypothetical protein